MHVKIIDNADHRAKESSKAIRKGAKASKKGFSDFNRSLQEAASVSKL